MNASANRRILLVDDTPSIHEDFRRILVGTEVSATFDATEEALFGPARGLGTAGFDLDSAYQGSEAIEMIRAAVATARPYALAFVDMRMPPGWGGVKTIQEIWRVDPRVQIVICTAYSDYSWGEVMATLAGRDRLLVLKKPFDNIEVSQLANTLTAKWTLTRQAELTVFQLDAAVLERTEELSSAIEKLKALVLETTRLATHDTLTRLPNRLLFADRAAHMLATAGREGTRPALLMIDLDRFKEVNDTLGHLQGDFLLCEVAKRLSGLVRPSDTLARFGGDEFGLLLADGGPEGAAAVAARIAAVLEAPFLLGTTPVSIEASVGISSVLSFQDGPTLESLLREADTAMYKAKADRSGFAHYTAGSINGALDRLTVIGELRHALDRGELVVYYQPQVALDTGELMGVEALVRWQHPTRGLLLPWAFIALAEESALIHRLTSFVLASTLRACRDWLDQGLRIRVSVNISARSLFDPAFSTMILDQLRQSDVPVDLLTIELTEGTIMAYPILAVDILTRLRDMGVRISVDDYGTGYSSMAYLKNLPVSELKIDRAFITDLTIDDSDAIIVKSSIDLGHNLGLSVVAEGVEDEATVAALRALGADIVQGYHIGHPMPEETLQSWMRGRATGAAERVVREAE